MKDSTFLSNSALPDESTRQSSSEVLKDMTFTGRGGALGLILTMKLDKNFAHVLL